MGGSPEPPSDAAADAAAATASRMAAVTEEKTDRGARRGAEGASAPKGAIVDIGQISARVPVGIGSF